MVPLRKSVLERAHYENECADVDENYADCSVNSIVIKKHKMMHKRGCYV